MAGAEDGGAHQAAVLPWGADHVRGRRRPPEGRQARSDVAGALHQRLGAARPRAAEALLRDVATADEDGYFRIVDRIKDLIIAGGMNVYPCEVEEVLTAHSAVDLAAVARRDERYGEVPPKPEPCDELPVTFSSGRCCAASPARRG
jgi:hypothetical protein